VEYSVEGLACCFGSDEKVFKRGPVSNLSLDKIHPRRQQIPPAVTQIVERHRLMSCFDKQFRHCTTYVPRPARDQYLHKKSVLSGTL
jgi:hypothetical protein